jgi:hypothetical protein
LKEDPVDEGGGILPNEKEGAELFDVEGAADEEVDPNEKVPAAGASGDGAAVPKEANGIDEVDGAGAELPNEKELFAFVEVPTEYELPPSP